MNVPEIRTVLKTAAKKLDASDLANAVVRVGLRACDEWDRRNDGSWDCCLSVEDELGVIVDILREAGAEVSK